MRERITLFCGAPTIFNAILAHPMRRGLTGPRCG